jgi:ABC-type dipeptide/oligopeptide/nickel transport system permease component
VLAPVIVDLLGVSGPNARDPGAVNVFGVPSGPSSAHPFGVDALGHDVLARTIYGIRSSLEVGALCTVISCALGVLVGLFASVRRRWLGAAVMAATGAFFAFPAVLLGLGVASACRAQGCVAGVISGGLGTVVLVVALSTFPYVACAVKGRRSVRELARALVACAGPLMAISILLEAALSFLGAGLRSSSVSLGQMVAGAGALVVSGTRVWWYLVFPGIALLICVLAFQLAGRHLRRLLEVRPLPPSPARAARVSATRYVAGCILLGIALLVAATAASYLFFRVLPGRASLGGFWHYMTGVFFHLDFGTSGRRSVLGLISNRLPATVSLTGGALVVCFALAIPIGLIGTISGSRLLGRSGTVAAVTLTSAPVFWLGLLGVYLFSTETGLVRVFDGPGTYAGLTSSAGRWFGSLLLPWLVVGAGATALAAGVLRSQLTDAMSASYTRVARVTGLRERTIMRRALRSALTALVPRLGLGLGALLSAVVLTEVVFKLPGIGRLAYDGLAAGDSAVVQGTVLFATCLIVIAWTVVAIVRVLLDPRVRER